MVSLGIIFGLFTAFFYAASNVLDAKLSHANFKHGYSLIVYASVLNGVFIPFLWAYHPPTMPQATQWGVLSIVALLEILALWAYFKAFKDGETSVVSCLLVLATIFVPLLSGLLGYEVLSLKQWLGFSLCVLAALWLTYQPQASATSQKAACWALLAGVTYAAINLGDDWLVNTLHWTQVYAFGQLLMVVFVMVPLCLSRHRLQAVLADWPIFKSNFAVFAATELVYLAGTATALWAFKRESVGVVAGLIATKPFFTMVVLQALPKNWTGDTIQSPRLLKKLICFTLVALGVVLFSK